MSDVQCAALDHAHIAYRPASNEHNYYLKEEESCEWVDNYVTGQMPDDSNAPNGGNRQVFKDRFGLSDDELDRLRELVKKHMLHDKGLPWHQRSDRTRGSGSSPRKRLRGMARRWHCTHSCPGCCGSVDTRLRCADHTVGVVCAQGFLLDDDRVRGTVSACCRENSFVELDRR